MSVANLFNIPKTPEEWGYWLLSNAAEHQQIVTAINMKTGALLDSFVLDPTPQQDTQNFLSKHQVMHDQAEAVLGVGGNDYTSLDLNDPKATEYLWQQHANEHIQFRAKLGI